MLTCGAGGRDRNRPAQWNRCSETVYAGKFLTACRDITG